MAVRDPNFQPRTGLTRTFHDARVLSGFMDDAHFRAFAEVHISHLAEPERGRVLDRALEARLALSRVKDDDGYGAGLRTLDDAYVKELEGDPEFVEAFQGLDFEFSWVDPRAPIPVQVWTSTESYMLPAAPAALVRVSLPLPARAEADVAQCGPAAFYVMSSAPQAANFAIEVDAPGSVSVRPRPHINLVYLVLYNGRFYIRNGTHRLACAARQGLAEIPSIVVKARDPRLIEELLLGPNGFAPAHLLAVQRAPRVDDFSGPFAMTLPMRDQRFGFVVSAQRLVVPI